MLTDWLRSRGWSRGRALRPVSRPKQRGEDEPEQTQEQEHPQHRPIAAGIVRARAARIVQRAGGEIGQHHPDVLQHRHQAVGRAEPLGRRRDTGTAGQSTAGTSENAMPMSTVVTHRFVSV